MKYIKNILLVLVMAAFTLNAYAVSAMTLCMCDEMAQVEMSNLDKEIPCHEMAKADTSAEQTDQDHNKSTKCEKCCGNCKVPTQASLLTNKAVTAHITKDMKHPTYSDVNETMFPYGIDYPPKRNS